MTFETKVVFCCGTCDAKAIGVVQFDLGPDSQISVDIRKFPRGWYGIAAWRPVYCSRCLESPVRSLSYERGLRDAQAKLDKKARRR